MPLSVILTRPEQAPVLEAIDSVVIAEFDLSGRLVAGNAGLHRIMADPSESLWQLITQPRLESIVQLHPDSAGEVYTGILTVRGRDASMVSLNGAIWLMGDRILLVGGYDMSLFDALSASLLELNNEVNTAYRELARCNRQLAAREQEVRELSETDPLTRVGNRRQLDEALVREVELAQRRKQPLSLIMLDLDHFKRINDSFGHPTGDRVLRETAAILRTTIRKADIVTRMGGEEFVILLPATGLAEAVESAERLRSALAQPDRDVPAPVTSSFGVSCLRPGETGASLLDRADRALYAAKRNGRNRVEVAID